MRIITNHVCASIIASIVLAGCASSKPEPIAETAPYTGVPISLHKAPGAGLVKAASAGGAIAYINARRAEVGLPNITVDGDVAAAAAAHARYMRLNNAFGHDETAGAQGFTGADVVTRVRAHTPAYGGSEVLSYFAGVQQPASAISEIFAAPFHRGVIFFDWARAGEAVDGSNITVVDFADIAPVLAESELVAYPYNGQPDDPTRWTDFEQPDPMGANSGYFGAVVGYPLTLSGTPNAHIVLKAFDLTDARGKQVACRIAPVGAKDTARNTAICTPFMPLKAGADYSVHATGIVTQIGSNSKAPFDLRWRFSTAPATNDRQTPRTNEVASH